MCGKLKLFCFDKVSLVTSLKCWPFYLFLHCRCLSYSILLIVRLSVVNCIVQRCFNVQAKLTKEVTFILKFSP